MRDLHPFSQTTLGLTDVFPFTQITSKLWGTFHKNLVEECLNQSLANLGVEYLDRKLNGDSVAKGVNAIYASLSYPLACGDESEWQSSFDTNLSGWKTRCPTRLEIARYLEADGGSLKEWLVKNLSRNRSLFSSHI